MFITWKTASRVERKSEKFKLQSSLATFFLAFFWFLNLISILFSCLWLIVENLLSLKLPVKFCVLFRKKGNKELSKLEIWKFIDELNLVLMIKSKWSFHMTIAQSYITTDTRNLRYSFKHRIIQLLFRQNSGRNFFKIFVLYL